MVIDSSALVAILLRESDADTLSNAILAASVRLIGAPSYLETAMVLIGRHGPAARDALDRLIAALAADLVPFTSTQAKLAVEAFLRFCKGRQHGAGTEFRRLLQLCPRQRNWIAATVQGQRLCSN
jgi:ribonuclease VapC